MSLSDNQKSIKDLISISNDRLLIVFSSYIKILNIQDFFCSIIFHNGQNAIFFVSILKNDLLGNNSKDSNNKDALIISNLNKTVNKKLYFGISYTSLTPFASLNNLQAISDSNIINIYDFSSMTYNEL
jgi:hypothetical protein